MTKNYNYIVGLILSLSSADCSGTDDDALLDDGDAMSVDGSAEKVDSANTNSGQTKNAANTNAKSSFCPSTPPQVGTACNGDISCSYDNVTGGYAHYDCALSCPTGCNGGGKYLVTANPTKAVCRNGSWTISSISGSSACNKSPDIYCSCPESGISSDAGM